MARAADELELPPEIRIWHESASLRAGVGYKDNVTLSSTDPTGSAFEQAGLDLMIFRLPLNNWQFTFLGSANDIRYFDSSVGVDTEQNAAASAQLTWFPGRNWKNLTTLQYGYLNQVLDVSATQQMATRQQVLGHLFTIREGVRKEFAPYWVEGSLGVSRGFYGSPLDDFWQGGPQVTLGRSYGHGSELALAYQVQQMFFDTREQTDLDGNRVAGSSLEFTVHNVELNWQHHWDARRRWRSATRLYLELNFDNGPGYYDYSLYRLGEQLRYRSDTWEFNLQVSVGHYDFPNRAVAPGNPDTADRTTVLLTMRLEKKLSKHWKVYAGYDHEESLSNVPFERYGANVGVAGAEYAF